MGSMTCKEIHCGGRSFATTAVKSWSCTFVAYYCLKCGRLYWPDGTLVFRIHLLFLVSIPLFLKEGRVQEGKPEG